MMPAATSGTDAFDWVKGWIMTRYGSDTADLYDRVWRVFLRYFKAKGITAFAGITRQTCFDYLLFRDGVTRNRVIVELSILSAVLREAVQRRLIDANPALALGIKRAPTRHRPEMPDDLLAEIEAAIDRDSSKYKPFFRISLALARYHGVRIRETRLPLSDVDFTTNTVRFRVKGGKEHVVPMHPKIRPMLERLAKDNHAWTFAEPSDPHYMSQLWQVFFKRHGFKQRIPGLVFHCNRVTVISKLARANISEAKAMRYVAHANSAIHAIYQRVRVADLQDCCDAL